MLVVPAHAGEVMLPSTLPTRTSPAMENLNQQIVSSPTASSFAARAAEYSKLGLNKQAIDDVEKAITLEPQNTVALLLRAEVYFDSGMFPETIRSAKDVTKADPKLVAARALEIRSFIRLREYRNALDAANELLPIDSNQAQALMLRGAAEWGLKNYDSARADLDNAIKGDSHLARAYYYRAKLNNDTQQFQKAVDDFGKAIELQPMSRDAILGRAFANYNLGNTDAALKDASAAIKFNSANVLDALNRYVGEKATNPDITPDPEYYLGEQMDEYLKDALVLYDDVLKQKPGNVDALRDRGLVYMHLAKYRDAIRDFEAANTGMPVNPTDFPGFGLQADYEAAKAEYELGNAALGSEQYTNAFNHYQTALGKYPYYARCWHNMAIACSKLGDNKSAELCCIHAISYRPQDWKLWNTLGYALFGEFKQDMSNPTKLDGAGEVLRQALELKPSSKEDRSDVEHLLASVKGFERSLAPVSDFVITTMPIN